MRKLSDTIARLAAMRVRQTEISANGSIGRLSTLSGFGSNPGTLLSRVYLPEGLSDGAPLVVVLHGCTQDAAGYDNLSGWSKLADRYGFALLYPEQQRSNNANLCFNWFVQADIARNSGEALSIRQMIEAVVTRNRLDRKRIFITGLSAGGAMACAMLATYPEMFAGGAIIAGLPYGVANSIPEAFDRMRAHGIPSEESLQRLLRSASLHQGPWPRISIWQGSADQTVAPANADALVAQWRAVHDLETAPTVSKVEGRRAKRVWCDGAGEAMLEVNLIEGMGHGTPLGNDGLGIPGPFMLDVGISSTQEIAGFWGISDGAYSASAATPGHAPVRGDRVAENAGIVASPDAAAHAPPKPPGSKPFDVKDVIEKALRSAGLMR